MRPSVSYGTTGLRKNSEGAIVRVSKTTIVLLVYSSLVLDNILLTVVVPILPVFLYQNEHLQQNSTPHSNLPLISKNQSLKWQKSTEKEVKAIVQNNAGISGLPFMAEDPDEDTTKLIHENARVGALFSSKAFVQLVVNPFIGKATVKFGYEIPFLVGTGFLLLSCIIFAVVSSFAWLLFARSLQGVASASIAVAGMGMIANLYGDEEERSRVMGLVLGGIAMGVLVGYPFGGLLFDFVGESSPFVLIGITIGSIWGLQLRYIVPSKLDVDPDILDDERPVSFRKLFFDVNILIVTGAVWVSTTAMALLEPCLPIWLMDTIHPEKWQLGTVFLPDSLGYLIGTNFFAVPALKLGRHRVAMAAMLLVGVSSFCIPLATSMWDLVLPHFALGLGIGVVDSALMPLLATLVDEKGHGSAYGSVYAVAQTAVSLAYGLGPLLGGTLTETYGFAVVMSSVGLVNVLYAPVVFLLGNSTAQSSHHEMKTMETGDVN